MNRLLLIITLLFAILPIHAVDWYTVTSSGQYYYGEAVASENEVADRAALDNLLQMIAVHVSSDFEHIYDGTTNNEGLVFEDKVRQCVRTYSTNTLTNVETMSERRGSDFYVRKWMLRSELERMYDERISRLKDLSNLADNNLKRGDIGVALRYYYYAYAMLRSLQLPNKVIDSEDHALINTLPIRIREILSSIKVEYVSREGDEVNLRFTYNGQPTSIDFTYNNGYGDGCEGKADGGNAYIEMAPGYAETGVYHIAIDYYKNWARGDAELSSILTVIPRSVFSEANHTIKAVNNPAPKIQSVPTIETNAAVETKKQQDQIAMQNCSDAINTLIEALQSHRYEKAEPYFVGRGLDNYHHLVTRRSGRLIGVPKPTIYQNACGNLMARGIQLAFAVTERGKKSTFVEDLVLTFDETQKITNLTFGIGSVAEQHLLSKKVDWGEDVRQQVLDFLENYKTAYCLKDTAYLDAVFDQNATIIVGHVARRTTHPGFEAKEISALGKEIITYKQYKKEEYITHLKQTFKRNQFVNLKFTENDVQRLKVLGDKVFGIQIRQDYNSSTYSDSGYLFLMVDLANPAEPVIKIRTWQPKPDPEYGWYTAGHFTID